MPHHLIDILEPHQEYSVAEYVVAAERGRSRDCRRGRVPLFVGGTGLYLRGVLRGVFEGPAADWELRRELEAIRASGRKRGPALPVGPRRSADCGEVAGGRPAARDPRDRSLRTHGNTPVDAATAGAAASRVAPACVLAASTPRMVVRSHQQASGRHVSSRTGREKFKGCSPRAQPLGKTARQALGYKEVIDHLERGIPLPETIALIQTRTRQFAKRQHTWFKNLVECTAGRTSRRNESPREIAEQMFRKSI